MKRKRKRRILKKIGLIILCYLIAVTIVTCIETYQANRKIADFISKGVLDESKSSSLVKYYKVPRETWMEEKAAFTYDFYLGTKGDIILSRDSPFDGVPFVDEFVTFYFGGHAAIVYDGYFVLDVTGKNQDKKYNVVSTNYNYWRSADYASEVIGLRIKNNPQESTNHAISWIESRFGEKYNYLFILNTKTKHYCTDLISKAFQGTNDLNYDGFVTTSNDLIVSKDTYLFLYRFVDEFDVEHIYYID